ncbi:MAG: patatin-like phospholipase family protein [Anaerolineae bacterium]|nr:patatin-like phospholipase family protein [Candidatus Roseilinea sp.]MDW8450167.1 patatin-like phospholipase family protein [Anaerolineae bacterium]
MARKRILAIDGGGIRGIIPLCALVELEKQLKQPAREFFSFMAGTSTGAIIGAGLARGLSAERCLQLYIELGDRAFRRNPLDWIISLGSFKYRTAPLVKLLKEFLGNPILNELPVDVMFTAMRVRDGKPFYFVKDNPANEQLTGKLRLVDCVAASSAAPTFFEPWRVPGIGACVDGGIGIAGNPCYQACVEAFHYMPAGKYPIAETTVVSLGTGFYKTQYDPSNLIEWVQWIVGELLDEPAAQQTQLVQRHYATQGLHLVRLNVQLPQEIGMDDIGAIPRLVEIGKAAAAKLNWDALLTPPAGEKTLELAPSQLPRNAPAKNEVIIKPVKRRSAV